MESLLEFIFSNIIYVVIIIGVISSILAKGKKVNGNGNGMPNFGGDPGSPGRVQRQRVPSQTLAQHSSQPRPPKAPEPAKPQQRRAPAAPQIAATQSHEVISDGRSPIYHPLVKGDLRDHAAEGMKWAEVFGKPRAYRKHSKY